MLECLKRMAGGGIGETCADKGEKYIKKTKTLMIIDDDKDIVKILTRFATGMHWRVNSAEDGVKAMSMLSTGKPDLILLDRNMPKMAGDELLLYIKGDPHLHGIPVVIITGDVEGLVKSVTRGVGILVKPFKIEVLEALLKAIL